MKKILALIVLSTLLLLSACNQAETGEVDQEAQLQAAAKEADEAIASFEKKMVENDQDLGEETWSYEEFVEMAKGEQRTETAMEYYTLARTTANMLKSEINEDTNRITGAVIDFKRAELTKIRALDAWQKILATSYKTGNPMPAKDEFNTLISQGDAAKAAKDYVAAKTFYTQAASTAHQLMGSVAGGK